MVQYIHFRILEFPLKKYRCFLGTPCPPLSEDKCISSLAKKMPASSSLNMMPISVRLCKKTHDTFSTISMSTLFSKHVRNTQALRNIFFELHFLLKTFSVTEQAQTVWKFLGQNTSWILINVETFEANRYPPPLGTVRHSQKWPGPRSSKSC